jgi:predicted N-acyltransferase
VLDDECELKNLLATRGYLGSLNVPVGVLDLRWRSFEDYMADLPRKSRAEFRRQINRNNDAGTTIEIADDASDAGGRLLELLDDNARKHGGRPFACGPGFFAELTRNLGRQARIFTARKSGAVTGVLVVLVHKETVIPVAVGVDASAAGDYTYFRLCYYAPIADAVESGMRRMYYGRGMYELKLRRGCRLVDTWIYTRESGPRRIGAAAWFALASFWNRYKLSTEARRSLSGSSPGSPHES